MADTLAATSINIALACKAEGLAVPCGLSSYADSISGYSCLNIASKHRL